MVSRFNPEMADGGFPLFVIGISSLIRHSGFLIRNYLCGWGLTPRVFLYQWIQKKPPQPFGVGCSGKANGRLINLNLMRFGLFLFFQGSMSM